MTNETTTETGHEECAYCMATVTAAKVPASDDAGAWAKIAAEHAATCEWVRTRAHRVDAA